MDTKPAVTSEPALACVINAIDAAHRPQHMELVTTIFASVQEVKALSNGFSFRVPTSSEMLLKIAEWMANERLCCPFFRFAVELEPGQGPIWIHLTGGEGVREFVTANFGSLLNEPIARAAGFHATESV